MATVHLARQIGAAGFARMVAVKRLHERFARDPDFVAMFLDEARIVGRIRHPNVVQTVDVVAEEGELFIVMEYVHGESLLRLMQMANRKDKVLPVPVTASIMVGALRGLHEAHEARSETGEPLGVVHRDVSPHNVLVGVDGIARVLDFGVAKASQRIQTTQTGHLKGKLSYMAPEQVTNRPVDRRTDVYAAAVVLWETLTGAKKFYGDSEAAILNQILLDPQRPPSTLNKAVSPELDAVVMKGISREPSDRYADAKQFAEAIERVTLLASASQVGDVLSEMCGASISVRQQLISSVEAKTSSSNLQEAVDSLRTLSHARTDPARGSDPAVARISAPAGVPIQTEPPPGYADLGRLPPPAPAPVMSFPPDAGGGTPEPMARRARTSGGVPSSAPTPSIPAQSKAGGAIAAIASACVLIVLVVFAAGFLFLKSKREKENAALAAAKASASAAGLAAAGSSSATSSVGSSMGSSMGSSSASSATSAVAPGVTGTVAGAGACPAGMAFIPGGRFFMGSDDDLPAEKPAHKVVLKGYCMDKLEVSTDAYRACSERGDCKRAGTTNRWEGITARESKIYDPLCNFGESTRGTHPINCIEWGMADRFCKAEGKRLPTEAEWEFAARGSDGRKFPWGDTAPTAKHLNACGNECVLWGKKHGEKLEAMFADSDPFATTAPVGSFPAGASRWGVEDIVGNVWEWTADYYGAYTEADVEDPMGPASGATRVMRGGAWNGSYPDWVRPSFRFHAAPDNRSHGVGFRCAKSL